MDTSAERSQNSARRWQ